MKRIILFLCCGTILCLSFFVLFGALPAWALGEWERYNRAEELAQQGNLTEAMALWEQLVDEMQLIGENEAAGFCAQKLARAYDRQGRYEEARRYYLIEAQLWDPLGHGDWTLVDKCRAETIDTRIKLFLEETKEASALPAGASLGKWEPERGAILGTTLAGNSSFKGSLAEAERELGRPLSGVLVYVLWGDLPSHAAGVKEAKEAGAALQVAWQLDRGLEAVQDGEYVRRFIRELKDYGGPVFLRFGGEMNGDWTPWHGNPELYVEKFRLIAFLVHSTAPNVAMVWSPNYVPDEEVDRYYPGDQWVDWVGINAYTDYYCNGNPQMNPVTATVFYQGKEANPLSKFGAIYRRYASRKPIMISETGVAWANRLPYEEACDWGAYNLERFYGYLPLVYPRIKGVFYFNCELEPGSRSGGFSLYALTQCRQMVTSFKRATASPWYLSRPDEESLVSYVLVNCCLPESGTLACYIPTGPARVARVQYWFNGELVGESDAPPWRVHYTKGQIVGAGTLKVAALDKDGRVLVTGEFSVEGAPLSVYVDGELLTADVKPMLVLGRVLVPARAVVEKFGAEVDWDGANNRVIFRQGGDVVELTIDNPVALKNGRQLPPTDVPARIVNNRTLVPLRFLLESFGAQVEWDQDALAVKIKSPV